MDGGQGGGAGDLIAWCIVTSSARNLLGSRRRALSYKLNNCINENMDLFRL